MTGNKPYGLVICGGKSTRMGEDKSSIIYFDKEQKYYVADMLSTLCSRVYISCNAAQSANIFDDYPYIIDAPECSNKGPLGGLLSFWKRYPNKNVMVVGCDYPYLTMQELALFFNSVDGNATRVFYNQSEGLYEPLLGFYRADSYEHLLLQYRQKNYSLQYFLKNINAAKYFGSSELAFISVDDKQQMQMAKSILKK